LFSDETIATVFRYSKGLPRLINTICENGLITAYARQLESVTPEIVEDVAKEFSPRRSYNSWERHPSEPGGDGLSNEP